MRCSFLRRLFLASGSCDPAFFVVPDLAIARAIADKRKIKQHEATQQKRVPLTLENLTQAKVAELKRKRQRQHDRALGSEATDDDLERRDFFSEMKKRDF